MAEGEAPKRTSERSLEALLGVEAIGWNQPGLVLDAGGFFLEPRVRSITDHLGIPVCKMVFYDSAPRDNLELRRAGNIFSYLYGDLRRLEFRDGLFNRVVCISTLEHIGMDNSRYGGMVEHDPSSWHDAVGELYRVTKPGGRLFYTMPHGAAHDAGWYRTFTTQDIHDFGRAHHGTNVSGRVFRLRDPMWTIHEGLNDDPAVDADGKPTQIIALWVEKPSV